MIETDVCIVGAGIAGLNTACQLAEQRPDLTIHVISRETIEKCNSELAQGGIALFGDPESHIQDTLIAGAWLANEERVRQILLQSSNAIKNLAFYGVQLDETDGQPDLIREGGHTQARIAHIKDHTGRSVMEKIRNKSREYSNLHILSNCRLVDLLVQNREGASPACVGCEIVFSGDAQTQFITCSAVVLATGGIGGAYRQSTNRSDSLGDGIVIAHRAGAKVRDMEFIQFHPTGLFHKNLNQCALVSEAVRGAGGVLRNHAGEAFMKHYDARGDLAPRDIVARAIFSEMSASQSEHLFLDCTSIENFANRFPTIDHLCRKEDIDPKSEFIPIVPVQHFLCGGIETNLLGETNISGLYACGECASTGLHGANRLASNSLLEGLIFSDRIAGELAKNCVRRNNPQTVTYRPRALNSSENVEILNNLKDEIRHLLQTETGVIRTNYGLQMAKEHLQKIEETIARIEENFLLSLVLLDVRNLLGLAQLIFGACMERKSNMGCHYNLNSDSQAIKSINSNIIALKDVHNTLS